MGFFVQLLDFFFPPKCIFCRRFLRHGEREMCGDCTKNLPFASDGDALRGEHFSLCVPALRYENNVREAIRRFKFKNQAAYAGCFGKLMAANINKRLADGYDMITWVPVSARRKKTRGYDQAMLLAYAVANELSDVAVEIIKKPTDVPAQSGINDADERRKNVLGTFEVVDAELIAGKRVLLIDDVVTTGSTLDECAKTLKLAGASEVICVALATAGRVRLGDDG